MLSRTSSRTFDYLQFVHLSLLILLVANISATRAQAQDPSPAKQIMDESNRREMDRMLLRTPIPKTVEDKSRNQEVLKQINADFRDLQLLNNKVKSVMQLVPSERQVGSENPGNAVQESIDYQQVAELTNEIKSKANRLKSNLALPKVTETDRKQSSVSSVEDFKSALLELDRLIVSFTTNPLFQKSNVVEVDLATKASKDLSEIIELSIELRKVAKRSKQ